VNRYALGIDGGGSKCDAVLLDETGAAVRRGRGGPIHVYYDPPEVITASYVEAITQALLGTAGADIWVAGPLPEGAPREAVQAANRLARHIPATEVHSAFASAQEDWGLIVLAGTGSFVHGRTPDGRHLHCGGLGPILDDYGSAYTIGLLGLRAAFASDWAPARRTRLAAVIPQALGVADRREIFRLVYVRGIGRRQIAALAKVVNAEAEAGDAVSIRCIEAAADELAEIAVDVLRELHMCELSFPVIPIGGVARGSRLWWQRICQRLSEVAPGMRPVLPRVTPAAGAALVALKEMGVAWTPRLLARVAETEEGIEERTRAEG
jgi:N-acetylglucosamine kinase-like BadF-type ATPase